MGGFAVPMSMLPLIPRQFVHQSAVMARYGELRPQSSSSMSFVGEFGLHVQLNKVTLKEVNQRTVYFSFKMHESKKLDS